MIKKLLLLLIVTFSSTALAQQSEPNAVKKDTTTVLKNVVASPNPFSVTTKIKFHAKGTFKIEFSVKDLIGNTVHFQRYTTKKGINYIPFYRDKLDSGIYIYSIKTNKEIISKRIVIK